MMRTSTQRVFLKGAIAPQQYRSPALLRPHFPILSLRGSVSRAASTTVQLPTSMSSEQNPVTGPFSFHKPMRVLESPTSRPTVVVLGSGWGAISFLRHIDTKAYDVIIVSPRSYFLFTPLLPSCPVGTVDEKSIIEPIASFANKKSGTVTYFEAEARSINPDRNTVTIESFSNISSTSGEGVNVGLKKNDMAEIKYDYLVSAVGSETNTFGIPGVDKYGCFLKEIADSRKIRHKFIEVVERANLLPVDDPERKRLLRIVIVGGGPTGVETAAELQDFVSHDLKTYMPNLANEVQITLVEALPVVLSMFEEKLTSYAEKVLKDTTIELMTRSSVTDVEPDYLVAKTKKEDGTTEETKIPYGVLVWATGNKPRKIVTDLYPLIPEQNNASKGLIVDGYFRVEGTRNIFAIGDNAFSSLAPTAQVAHQSAEFLCSLMNKMSKIKGFPEELKTRDEKIDMFFKDSGFKPFKYVHYGALAYLGADRAVANITYGKRSFYSGGGVFTFYVWRALYLSMILSWRSRFKVMTDWFKNAFFGRDTFKEL